MQVNIHIYIFYFIIHKFAEDYIQNVMDNNLLTRHSRFHKWYPVTVEEFGVIINIGLIQFPK